MKSFKVDRYADVNTVHYCANHQSVGYAPLIDSRALHVSTVPIKIDVSVEARKVLERCP